MEKILILTSISSYEPAMQIHFIRNCNANSRKNSFTWEGKNVQERTL